MTSYQNIGRLPIIDQTQGRTWGVVQNPFGDEPECAGFYISCYDPRVGHDEIVGDWYPTAEAAQAGLEEIAG